jgi:predicted DsbA family dithiol-disulfide isomerase
MIEAAAGTIVIYADIGCPWAHLSVYRLHEARADLGLKDEVVFEPRAFALEIFNERPTPRAILDAEIPVAGGADPGAKWQIWQGPDSTWPVTTLPALEAVEAAKDQGARAAEELDRALRIAFFGESKTISMRHVILEVARACSDVDAKLLAEAFDEGRARSRVMQQVRVAESDDVKGSPHLFLADGTDFHNPGVDMSWEGPHGKGFPVIHHDDPSVYVDILHRAVSI